MSNDNTPERASFDTVVMNREKLIAKLAENKAKHREAFDLALEGYREKNIQLLEEHLDRLRKGSKEAVFVHLPLPEDHTADYDALIDALSVQSFDQVALPMEDWRCYYRDEWVWKRNWTTSNSDYVALGTSRKMGAQGGNKR